MAGRAYQLVSCVIPAMQGLEREYLLLNEEHLGRRGAAQLVGSH